MWEPQNIKSIAFVALLQVILQDGQWERIVFFSPVDGPTKWAI